MKDCSKNVLELPLQIGGITSRKESFANRVFSDLFNFCTSSHELARSVGSRDQPCKKPNNMGARLSSVV